MARGDTHTIKITATFPEAIPEQSIAAGASFPLSGKTVYFTAKRSYQDTDDTIVVFKKTTTSGITVRANPNQHIADVAIAKVDTESLYGGTTLYCDCRVKDGTNIWTVAKGTITITDNATRTT